jgi:hypothetical protein
LPRENLGMTINSTSRTAGPFICNGVMKDFPFAFKVFTRTDVLVALTDTGTDVETILTLDSDFTVTLNSDQNTNPGGIVTTTVAPAAGKTLAATSNIPFLQKTDLTNQGGFYPRVISDALDKLTILAQQLNSKVGAGISIGSQAITAAALAALQTVQTIGSANGAEMVGLMGEENGSILHTVADHYRERVSVFQFMTAAEIADVKARTYLKDVTTAMQKARDAIAISRKKLVFPAGGYKYSQSPNWAIHHAQIEFEGDVNLRYTGIGDAVKIDADGADAVTFIPGHVYGVKFGWGIRPSIEAPATAGNGVFCRATHHCKVGARVRGTGATKGGLYTRFAVCTEFDVEVSGNVDGWYLGARPNFGYNLDKRNAGETTSYCMFQNPIVEGPIVGIQLVGTLGNNFIGGTSEACRDYGLYASPAAEQDKFYGTDFEVNGIADVYDMGQNLLLDNCDTYTQLTLGTSSRDAKVIGGLHSKVLFDAGCTNATARDFTFNRFGDGSTFVDAGTGTVIENVRNGGTDTLILTAYQDNADVPIANGGSVELVLPVPQLRFGDHGTVGFSANALGIALVTQVSAAGYASVIATNNTGANLSLPAGRVTVKYSRG